MIPVPTECLIKLDVKKIPDNNEKIRISKELAFCRKNKDKIEKFAQMTYADIVNQKNEKLVSNSCDFKLLEQAYIEYCIINKLDCPHIDEDSLKFIEETLKIAEWCEEAQEKASERLAERGNQTHER